MLNNILLFSIILLFSLLYWSKTKTNQLIKTEWERQTCLKELLGFVTNNGGHFLSHLMFLNDKYGYWAVNKAVYFSFQKMAGRIIVLGDPIGHKHSFDNAIEELEGKCERHRVKSPIFYQVSSKYSVLYEKLGYRVIKIGEEGKVNLREYHLNGKQGAKLRTRRYKFERNGFTIIAK
jgi:phosphatidylglycerol lysyltransferase